jgi:hypothetical protein
MKYVVIHNHPEKLVLRQSSRDILFSTGSLLELIESDLHSFQVFAAKSWGDCYALCRGLRPCEEEWKDESGVVHLRKSWSSPEVRRLDINCSK